MIPITVKRTSAAPVSKPTEGFHYVDQGNYLTLPVEGPGPLTLYSDSATSCIITIVAATIDGATTLTLAHLDSPSCITAFFDIVRSFGASELQVYAQGANPPDNETSIENAAQLEKEVAELSPAVAELFLREGNPREDNLGDFGVTASDGGAIVTNLQYTLALTERDPTCGGQTVYCIMRRQENPPIEIRDAGQPFSHDELVELSKIALEYRQDPNNPATSFTNIVTMENEDIRQAWSTTPEYEAPWFSDQLKLGAVFALAMAPVVSLSAQYLCSTSTFSRLRKALRSSD